MHLILCLALTSLMIFEETSGAVITKNDAGESSVHFNFKTENGYSRTEDIKFNNTAATDPESMKLNDANNKNVAKAVEYRGGYSFISADGYEYMVLYKANKNGFYPFVTARKLKDPTVALT